MLTLYALFGDDIRVTSFTAPDDYKFDIINIICLSSFFVEFVVSSICKQGYLFSFFFFLDFISTFSILLDIQMFTNAIGLTSGKASKSSSIARAGRASRIGTRAGRIVRLIRLIRLVKLYKTASKTKTKEERLKEIMERKKK